MLQDSGDFYGNWYMRNIEDIVSAGGAVTGWAACRLASANFLDGLTPDGRSERPVQLVVGPGQSRRKVEGVDFLQDRIDPAEVVGRLGIPCTLVADVMAGSLMASGDVDQAEPQVLSALYETLQKDRVGWSEVYAVHDENDLFC